MKIDLENRKRILSVVALAFFNFVFLGAEYMFDNMMTYVASSESVVLAESYILGSKLYGILLISDTGQNHKWQQQIHYGICKRIGRYNMHFYDMQAQFVYVSIAAGVSVVCCIRNIRR